MARNETSRIASIVGWIMTLMAAGIFLMSAIMKLSMNPKMLPMLAQLGWSPSSLALLATLELGSVLLYLVPPVSVLGGIVLTGFLGGAIATHVRVGQPVYVHVVIGLFIWGGLYLREPRLRALIPFRTK